MSTPVRRPAPGRGRPRGTSHRDLELIALRLFSQRGFEETTLEQIASEAGISKRTFFRYFDSKASVLWSVVDEQVATIRTQLADVPPDVPTMEAIRHAVVAVNRYEPEDVPEVRTRMNLIGSAAALSASATSHYEAWEGVIAEFVARRTGQPADSLVPRAVGRATLATVRAAYDTWVAAADTELSVYVDQALLALADGFSTAEGAQGRS